jgi:HAD superfamily hydrolase (TIGR01509 family)
MIFFDIDETLIDQRRAEAAAARQVLAEYGNLLNPAYSVDDFCRLWRRLREKHAPAFLNGIVSAHENRRRRIRDLFAWSGGILSDSEADAVIAFYENHYRSNWVLFEDVLPALEALGGRRCGVISNGSGEQQKLKLERTGIDRYFDIVIVSEEIGVAKPRREIFLTACRQAGSPAHRCIYVGDRLDHGALASRAAGMRSFWLRRRRTQEESEIEVISSLNQLAWKLRSRIAV